MADSATAEVRQALARPGCALCHLVHRSVGRYLRSLSYEQVNDIAIRDALRASRGFCQVHAHRWLTMTGNVLGTAVIYRDVINAAARALDAPGPGKGLFGSRPRQADCVACTFEADAEGRYLDGLLENLSAFDASSEGLCLPHTRQAVERAGRRAEPLVALAREHAARLVAELDEVIRKEDYRFKDEPRSETDRTAPRRAVTWAAGLESSS